MSPSYASNEYMKTRLMYSSLIMKSLCRYQPLLYQADMHTNTEKA